MEKKNGNTFKMIAKCFQKSESIQVNSDLSIECRMGIVKYCYKGVIIFQHNIDDLGSFKMFVSELYIIGACKQVELCKALKISQATMKRYVKKFQKSGPKSFYLERKQTEGSVITEKVKKQSENLLLLGSSPKMIAKKLNIKTDTLSKSIRQGRIVVQPKPLKRTEKRRCKTDSNVVGYASYQGNCIRRIYI